MKGSYLPPYLPSTSCEIKLWLWCQLEGQSKAGRKRSYKWKAENKLGGWAVMIHTVKRSHQALLKKVLSPPVLSTVWGLRSWKVWNVRGETCGVSSFFAARRHHWCSAWIWKNQTLTERSWLILLMPSQPGKPAHSLKNNSRCNWNPMSNILSFCGRLRSKHTHGSESLAAFSPRNKDGLI